MTGVGTRVLYGVDRPPRGVAWDHPRVPSVLLGPQPLRLNTHPVPAAFLTAGIERADRRQAVREWLELGCGDYAVARVRFVTAYLAFVEVEIQRGLTELETRLFDGLYHAADWAWSALRPLPRAWILLPSGPAMADFAFWDGQQLFAVQLGASPHSEALREAGAVVLQTPADPDQVLPDSFRKTWRGEGLPSSPFRRAITGP